MSARRRQVGTGPRRSTTRPSTATLLTAAREARGRAIAPFSGFAVGAALEADDGTVFTGCNIENATYGLTLCAERVAIFKALSDGHRRFRRIAVVADTEAPTTPCGPCRQILWEFAGDIEVVLANMVRETGRFRASELLPSPFDARRLSDDGSRGADGATAPDARRTEGPSARRRPSRS